VSAYVGPAGVFSKKKKPGGREKVYFRWKMRKGKGELHEKTGGPTVRSRHK